MSCRRSLAEHFPGCSPGSSQAWTSGLIGFAVAFVALMIPWINSQGAVAGGLRGAAAGAFAFRGSPNGRWTKLDAISRSRAA